jgi:hypothetical protein
LCFFEYTTEEPYQWTIEDVYHWAVEVAGISEKSASILRDNEVDGESLLSMSEEKFIKSPYNMPGGSATKLSMAIKSLRNEWAKRIACMKNTN